jgi:hypothetical protein
MIISGAILCALFFAGAVLGLKLARIMREQFDELLPQRMIDYNGFVDVGQTFDKG